MVRIEVYTDTAGRIHGFAAKGHSGFAPHGQDIVCAAVSVLLQTAVLVGKSGRRRHRRDCRWAACMPPYFRAAAQPKAEAVLEAMLVGLASLQQNTAIMSVH